MRRNRFLVLPACFAAVLATVGTTGLATPQKLESLDRDRARQMLREAYENVKKNYYDPRIHGLDWDARYRQYDDRIKAATSLGHAFAAVAAFLEGLDDSHTYFRPPSRPYRIEPGFRMEIIGDAAFITRIRPETDAASKVHPGDQVISYNGYEVHRDDFHALSYYFNTLSPRQSTKLVFRDPAGRQHEVTVEARTKQERKLMDLTGSFDPWQLIREEENADHQVRQRYYEIGDVMIWKMPEFFLENDQVDHLFSIARKHKALILDLRENHGGLVDTLSRMIGNLFNDDIKIADRTGRKPEMKPQLAKSVGNRAFSGALIVLIDAASASAAELFARVVQLEHRGTVLGDRSSGSVMEAKGLASSQGIDTKIFYSFSITEADLIMKDGKSLEHTGVVPDEIVLPTAQDLAAGRDPVLSRAAQLAGINISPDAAGKMFPFEWLPF